MKTSPCECGCGAQVPKTQLHTVRVTSGAPRLAGRQVCRDARSFRVAPACVQPFMAELRATERLRNTQLCLPNLPRWRRLRYLPRLWLLRRAMLVRRLGGRAATRQAWSSVFFALRVPHVPCSGGL